MAALGGTVGWVEKREGARVEGWLGLSERRRAVPQRAGLSRPLQYQFIKPLNMKRAGTLVGWRKPL